MGGKLDEILRKAHVFSCYYKLQLKYTLSMLAIVSR